MINEEEKKAIKYFYNLRSTIDESYMLFDEEINLRCGKEMIKQITIFLNLITKLQKENEKKDKGLNRQFKLLNKKDKEIEKKNKILDLILDKFKEGTEYYYSEFDYMSKEELFNYFEKQAKEKGD